MRRSFKKGISQRESYRRKRKIKSPKNKGFDFDKKMKELKKAEK